MIDITKVTTVITHNGLFHPDDAMAVAIIKYFNPNISVERTRDPKIINEKEKDKYTMIVDVGDGKYDHHQPDAELHEDGSKYAACGLIFRDYGSQIFNDELKEKFEEQIIRPIEHEDNGESIDHNNVGLITDYCNNMVPAWDSDQSMDEAFEKTVNTCLKFIKEVIQTQNIDQAFVNIKLQEEIDRLKETNLVSLHKGQQLALETYEKSNRKDIIILPHPGIDWTSVLPKTEANFVIYRTSSNQVNLQAVPPETNSFDQKILIPKDILDDLRNSDVYPEDEAQPFVHSAGFLAALPLNEQIDEEEAINILTIAAEYLERDKQINSSVYRNELSMAKNPDTDSKVLANLAKHEEREIRREVAKNPNTDLKTLKTLKFDQDFNVRHLAVDSMSKILEECRQYATREDADPHVLDAMLSDVSDEETRIAIIKSPKIAFATLRRFIGNKNENNNNLEFYQRHKDIFPKGFDIKEKDVGDGTDTPNEEVR
jgi:uncharacterized UPF0160 family protein